MPELPEVETVRRTLAPALGWTIAEVSTSRLAMRGKPIDRTAIARALEGKAISGLRRFGKYLLVDVGRDTDDASLLIHLGMSGRFRLFAADTEAPPHTHLTLVLAKAESLAPARGKRAERSGTKAASASAVTAPTTGPAPGRLLLRFSDPRRFGQVELVSKKDPRSHPSLANLGPDPLVDGVDPAAFAAVAKRSGRAAKAVLLDQTVLAGVGNIYASEALWQAKVPPTARTNRLSIARLQELAAAVPEVLRRALENGGTSLKDFVDADGHAGDHASYLWVYDREGQGCVRPGCDGIIRRTVVQGRATFDCPRCQRR